ncbi:HAD-superfamily hydrolase, subfamily IA, variant 3 [Candidatus Moduliflexus flocculans]|uniref:HAD-superfamily hydrolase, subfamily IA, variant 3 n=1 Tax=Candidatus Moduliflexus flocculans TaxID=1499966 RepID=A0A0S6VV03_9BACT|nr:HAD-superfamily hydrolase, subfamily IA, variant 3 [Candidatus Moduliflexus flocculans]
MFDTEQVAVDAWKQAGQTCGHDIPESLIIQSVGRNADDTKRLFEQALEPEFDFQQVRALRIQYAADIIEQRGVPVKDGLFELLDVLDHGSVLKAVATSTERIRAETLLRKANVHDRFDAIICGDEVQHGKPAPDIFLLAANRLQTIPYHCFVLEDSEAGIQAAVNAKMHPMMIPDLKPPSQWVLATVKHIFPSLHRAASYFSEKLAL